jgi:hypothetical protein
LNAITEKNKADERLTRNKIIIISQKLTEKRRSSVVATPGRVISGMPKFMPKKRGRLGFKGKM